MSLIRRGRRRSRDDEPPRSSRAVTIGGDSSGIVVTGENADVDVRQYASVSTTVVIIALALALVAAAGIAWMILSSPSRSAASPPVASSSAAGQPGISAADAVQVGTTWCLNDSPCPVHDRHYYWPGSVGQLDSALSGVAALTSLPGLTALGSDRIWVTVQSASTESVFLTGLRLVNLHRSPNPSTGLNAVAYCECGGSPTAVPLGVTVDDPQPTVLALGADDKVIPGRTGFPLTASQTDADTLLLTVGDTTCSCTFDLDLSWTIRGQSGDTVLTNQGRHFTVLGTRGLPVFSEVPSGRSLNGTVNNSSHSEMVPG